MRALEILGQEVQILHRGRSLLCPRMIDSRISGELFIGEPFSRPGRTATSDGRRTPCDERGPLSASVYPAPSLSASVTLVTYPAPCRAAFMSTRSLTGHCQHAGGGNNEELPPADPVDDVALRHAGSLASYRLQRVCSHGEPLRVTSRISGRLPRRSIPCAVPRGRATRLPAAIPVSRPAIRTEPSPATT